MRDQRNIDPIATQLYTLLSQHTHKLLNLYTTLSQYEAVLTTWKATKAGPTLTPNLFSGAYLFIPPTFFRGLLYLSFPHSMQVVQGQENDCRRQSSRKQTASALVGSGVAIWTTAKLAIILWMGKKQWLKPLFLGIYVGGSSDTGVRERWRAKKMDFATVSPRWP